MNRWTIFMAVIIMGVFAAIGCSGGSGNLMTPLDGQDSNPLPMTGAQCDEKYSQTQLWGYYDIHMDLVNRTVESVVNRAAMFTVNVVDFVNNPVSNLGLYIHGVQVGTGYIDVDIDVSIKHPFTGLSEFDGYDVRGVFIGEGSASMDYNHDLVYAVYGADQFLYDYDETDIDPHDGLVGMPDGYTRWHNAVEFHVEGLFGYSQGAFATPGYTNHLSATLNPYKYFADGLGVEDDLWDFLNDTDDSGVFSAGETNTRNYYIRFPTPEPNIAFGYAILANWESVDIHPSNASEAVACSVTVTDDIWFEDPANNDGDLILEIDIFDWDSTVSPGGAMEDYTIIVESNVLSAIHTFDTAEMTPVDGSVNYSTYSVEIPADEITFNSNTADGEVWVIVEDSSLDYTNDFGIENLADTDPLAAFFHKTFYISDEEIITFPGFVVVGNANIDIGTGTPGEIAVDPESDRTAVGFDGNLIRVFTDTYSVSTSISFPWYRPFEHYDYNDTYGVRDHSSPNGYGRITWSSETYTSMPNGISFIDWCNKLGTTQIHGLFWYSADSGHLIRSLSDYQFEWTSLNDAEWWGGTGTDGIVPENVVALDIPVNTSGLYILEGLPATNTAVVELHTFAWNNASYGGLSFGEGTLYDPLDLTVDSNDYIYILDVNAVGDPAIYAYDNTGILIAESGSIPIEDISGTPLRIDAGVFPNPDEVHVLHTGGVTRFTIEW